MRSCTTGDREGSAIVANCKLPWERTWNRYLRTESVWNPGSEAKISGETLANRRTRLFVVPET